MRLVSEDNDWETYNVEQSDDDSDVYEDGSMNEFRVYGDRAVRLYCARQFETSDWFTVEA